MCLALPFIDTFSAPGLVAFSPGLPPAHRPLLVPDALATAAVLTVLAVSNNNNTKNNL
jgi:hypothetical protein